jgi:outer membrane protein OmpA-like peptidoglycan-associated protein
VFEEQDRETGYAVFIAVTVAIVVSLFAIAVAVGTVIGPGGAKPAAPKATAPSIVRVLGKVYFEVGKADLPEDAPMLLRPAVRMARAIEGSKLVVSGYHDASGDAAANAELAKRRALAVRDMLIAAGVSEQRIELAKPVVTMGGTDDAEARRVEVTLR